MDTFLDKEKPYVFISYKREDRSIIEEHIAYLREVYGLNVWYDAALKGGSYWDKVALPILRDVNCKVILLYASELALMSENVEKEIDTANDFDKPIIPINFSGRPFKETLKEINIKYNKTNADGVTTATRLVKEHLPPERTYVLLNGADFYRELVDAIVDIDPTVLMLPQADKDRSTARTAAAISMAEKRAVISETPHLAPPPTDEDEPSPQEDTTRTVDTPPLEKPVLKKPLTVTGDITFSIYGQEHTENQSGMMLTVFQEVLRRHQDAVDELIDRLNCASDVDYEDSKNRGDAMPSYFRVCKTFRLTSVGKQICIGTAYSYADKLKLIAKLFAITGEDPAVLEGVELPSVRVRAPGGAQAEEGSARPGTRGDELTYHVYHYDGVGNQSELMYDVYSEVLKRHPDKLDEAVERLTSLSLTDYTLPENRGDGMPTYFRNSKSYVVDGRTFCVGASYGIKDKLIQIAKLLTICGEPADILTIDGMEFPPASGKPGRRGGRTSSGPTEL